MIKPCFIKLLRLKIFQYVAFSVEDFFDRLGTKLYRG